ncbi:MAG: hypothetical protein KF872_05915 [Chitinophagales bacterium]|nr:hypothetical protein [Chitinophagales bacterium]
MQEVWEQELINAISAATPWCGVLPYPERPEQYFLKHQVGEVLVRYERTKYSEGDAEQVFQPSDVQMELILVFRRLRGKEAGAQGLYYTTTELRNALYGERLTNATSGIQFVQEDMLGEHNGVWQYGIKLGFKSILVKGAESEYPAPTELDLTLEQHEYNFSGTE